MYLNFRNPPLDSQRTMSASEGEVSKASRAVSFRNEVVQACALRRRTCGLAAHDMRGGRRGSKRQPGAIVQLHWLVWRHWLAVQRRAVRLHGIDLYVNVLMARMAERDCDRVDTHRANSFGTQVHPILEDHQAKVDQEQPAVLVVLLCRAAK